MKVVKQFVDKAVGICRLVSEVDAFVPEMSLPIRDILNQFAFIDGVRLKDLALQGYDVANDDEDDFHTADFDQMDMAEREELRDESVESLRRIAAEQSQEPEPPTEPQE